jgi:predicted RNA-binding Zn-ribbon protein involved in translation (DUF1610 family)
MELRILQSFSNYMEAHIVMGRLEEEGIRCWLKDENTVTTGPFLTNAVGGVKIMVAKDQWERANALLQDMNAERRKKFSCPQCGSSDIELVTTPRKLSNWLGAIGGFLFGDFAIGVDKVWHCFNCKAEFKEPKESDHP